MKVNLKIEIAFSRRKASRSVADQAEKGLLFFRQAHGIIAQRVACRQYSTASNYQTAVRSLMNFCGNERLLCSDFSAGFLADYERWLCEKGISSNTSSCYMRSLRALLRRMGTDTRTAFDHVYTGRTATEKRAIMPADVRRLRNLELREGSHLCLCRDLFLMSVYCQGMPFVDLAHLKPDDIGGGYIRYRRRKTRQPVAVAIEPCILDIMNKYRQRGHPYVFPILKADNADGRQHQYHSALVSYNRSLKILARRAGIDHRLTSYVARHTWASVAHLNGVDIALISRAMGHTNTRTTLLYIKELNPARQAEANRRVLGSLGEAT